MSTVRMHVESQIEIALYKRRDKSFCLTDKPLITLYMALGCLYGYCTYFLVLKPGRKYALISQYVLKSYVGALNNPRLRYIDVYPLCHLTDSQL